MKKTIESSFYSLSNKQTNLIKKEKETILLVNKKLISLNKNINILMNEQKKTNIALNDIKNEQAELKNGQKITNNILAEILNVLKCGNPTQNQKIYKNRYISFQDQKNEKTDEKSAEKKSQNLNFNKIKKISFHSKKIDNDK